MRIHRKTLLLCYLLLSLYPCLLKAQQDSDKNCFTCKGKFEGPCTGKSFRYDLQNSALSPNIQLRGKVKSCLISSYSSITGDISYTVLYKFDEQGKLTSSLQIRKDKSVANKSIYLYGKNDQYYEQLCYYYGDTLHYDVKEVCEFKKRTCTCKSYNAKGRLMLTAVRTYDEKGYCKSSFITQSSGTLSDTMYYVYNAKGLLTKQISVRNGKRSTLAYLYDKNNNARCFISVAQKDTSWNNGYDHLGNAKDKDERYEYDAQNNWLKKFKKCPSGEMLLEKKEIVYYP